MKLDDEYRLSFYRQVADLSEAHSVYLVQNITNKKIYVKKLLDIYNFEVFDYLKKNPIKNTPRIYEAVEDSGRLIVIEEYLCGNTLQQILDEKKTLAEPQIKCIIRQLCLILIDFHNSKPPIVHRDIKPSNIIISPDGIVKLIDMNAAKWVRGNIGRDTVLMGTVGYAAPEQYGFASSGIQTDIYSVGVLINIMFTGVLPGEHRVFGKWGEIIINCTKMDPSERYSSFDQIIAAINRIDENTSDSPPAKFRYAPPGFRSGNPLKIVFASIIYLLTAAAALSLTFQDVSASEQWLYRIGFLITLFAVIFFLGNYIGIQNKTGIRNIKSRLVRIIIKLFIAFNILISGTLIIVIISNIIK